MSKAAVTEVQDAFIAALTTSNVAALEDILTDTYVDTEDGGHLAKKTDLLAVLESGDLKLTSIKASNVQTISYGTSAVQVGTAAQTGSFKGQPIVPVIVFTDTFVLTDRGWKVAASHRNAAPKG